MKYTIASDQIQINSDRVKKAIYVHRWMMLKKTLCLNSCTGKTRICNIHFAYLTKADEFTKIFYEPKSYKTHNLCIKKEVPSLKKKKMHKLQGNGMTETSKPNQIMAPT